MRSFFVLAVPAIFVLATSSLAAAQESSLSEPLAKQVAQLMKERKLDCIAATEAGSPDRFVAALYFPNQLLVVSARYTAPTVLRERVLTRDYREVYQQLQGAGEQQGKLFVQDIGVDGLHVQPSPAQPLDLIYQSVTTRTAFDGNWKQQGLTEQQYRERFKTVDQKYAELLKALLAQANQAGSF